MTTVVAMKAIKPKRLKVDAFTQEWNKVLDDTAQHKLKPDIQSTIQTFKRKPDVEVKDTSKGNQLSRAVYIEDEIYFYLARGTRIRWALMSRDWRSKTKPKRIPAGHGQGRAIVVGRRAMQARGIAPRPGIKAREFDILIAKKRNRGFVKDVHKATVRAAKRAF